MKDRRRRRELDLKRAVDAENCIQANFRVGAGAPRDVCRCQADRIDNAEVKLRQLSALLPNGPLKLLVQSDKRARARHSKRRSHASGRKSEVISSGSRRASARALNRSFDAQRSTGDLVRPAIRRRRTPGSRAQGWRVSAPLAVKHEFSHRKAINSRTARYIFMLI